MKAYGINVITEIDTPSHSGTFKNIDDAVVKAIIAGNDLIITKDYVSDISKIKAAIKDNTISTQDIDNMALRVIAWKYYKGMMFTTNQK